MVTLFKAENHHIFKVVAIDKRIMCTINTQTYCSKLIHDADNHAYGILSPHAICYLFLKLSCSVEENNHTA